MSPSAPGRFTTGSTMRHVAVMTLTGSLGLTFMFLVDFATLFYISLLDDAALTAGVGFAWAVQFFTISVGIGLAIAATALVSRAIGARERAKARRIATAATVITIASLVIVALAVLAFRDPILGLIGATGEAGAVASRFLVISVPSLPFMGLGMIGSSILRAEGDARRSMLVTMLAGVAAMILDPLFIFGFGLGVDGAAAAMVLSRMASGSVGLYFCIRAHDLLARPALADIRAFWRPFAQIALPGMATQLSTPFGNFLLTGAVAAYGDNAVAGWAVATRLTVLAFGGIFALSGAIGGILGQNYGARLPDRVAAAYRDSIVFACGYVLVMWAILLLFSDLVVSGFGVSGEGEAVVRAFCLVGAGAFLFAALLFVANAAFNNLHKPLWSTGFNWARDAAAIPLLLLAIGVAWGAPGVVYAQAGAGLAAGIAAAAVGWRLVHRLDFDEPDPGWRAVAAPPVTARSANAILQNEELED